MVFPLEALQQLEVGSSSFVIGREGEGLSLALPVPSVSRKHLRLEWDDAQRRHVAHDEGSRHGSTVDGVPLDEPVTLSDQSVLRLADAVLVYEQVGTLPVVVETDALPGRAEATVRLRDEVARAAKDTAPALILGATGVGKESVAAELHRLSGRGGPFLAVNCAALSPQLAESQLFGHVRGAFTGADAAGQGLFRAAAGGTLFLDEIGELSAELQPKLLRALQQREVLPVGATAPVKVEVRVVAATNRDLGLDVERGAFRRDLYARLALWELRVPTLAQRRVDLVSWVVRLQQKWATERRTRAPAFPFDAEAVEALLLAPWPENLRTVDRLVHQVGGQTGPLGVEQLPEWVLGPSSAPTVASPEPTVRRPSPSAEELLATLERLGSVRATAKHYGRDRRQIYRWIEAWQLAWRDRDEPR